jgi:cytochrome c oxidase subunit 3
VSEAVNPGAAERAALREPWGAIAPQRHAVEIGIWIFIASELLFFGGLFAGYGVYRTLLRDGFLIAGQETDLLYGAVNTVILVASSALVAVAQRAARWPELRSTALGCLWGAVALGVAFLIVKGFEYADDLARNLFPGPGFSIAERGAQVFFAFYWVMTGIHAVHLIIGIGLLSRLAIAGRRSPDWFAETPAVDATALYWGLVDAIWAILFVLIYLGGRAT